MSKKIVVTVCSASYLAQTKALGDSLLKHNPDYTLLIGLVDKLNGRVQPGYYHPHELIEAESLHIPEFREMCQRYTALELICALKSFFLQFALDTYKPEVLYFLDCDIMIFDSFRVLEEELNDHSILLSPHITTPFPRDNLRPEEKDILKTGIFNAGFLGLKNDATGQAFLDWWKIRMIDQAYERPKEGLNVDQKWLNFVPLYFEKVKTIRHAGCNLAYWNFHERTVEKKNEKFFANQDPLIFFHYSGYSAQQPDKISRHQTRFSMQDNAAVKELFDLYQQTLMQNDHLSLQKLTYYYKKESTGLLNKIGLKKK